METLGTIITSLQPGEWPPSIGFKVAYSHTPIQTQAWNTCIFQMQGHSYQFKHSHLVWSQHSGSCVTVVGKEAQLWDYKRYNNPPVRLLGQNHNPPSLSLSYPGSSSYLSGVGLVAKHGEIRTGPQASLPLHRLPVPPGRGQGQTCPGMLADLKCKNPETSLQTRLGS